MNEENNIYVGGQETTQPEPQKNQNPDINNPELFQPDSTQISSDPVKTKSSKKLLIIIIIILVIVILGFVATYFFVFNKSSISTYGVDGRSITIANTPSTVESQFINDLILANYKGAYNLTSSNMQANQNLAIFDASTKFLNIKQLQLENLKETTIKGVVVESGQLDIQNHPLFVFSSRLIKQNFEWKVDNLVVH